MNSIIQQFFNINAFTDSIISVNLDEVKEETKSPTISPIKEKNPDKE